MYKISFIYENGRGEQGNCYSYRDFVYLFFLLLFQDAKEGVLRNLRGFFEKKKSLQGYAFKHRKLCNKILSIFLEIERDKFMIKTRILR